MSTEELVVHVQAMLRAQNMDLSGNQTIVISDELSPVSPLSPTPTTPAFTTTTTATSNPTISYLAVDQVTDSIPIQSGDMVGDVLHIPEGTEVTLLDHGQNVTLVMEDGSVVQDAVVTVR
jgi:hypothetical protein